MLRVGNSAPRIRLNVITKQNPVSVCLGVSLGYSGNYWYGHFGTQ